MTTNRIVSLPDNRPQEVVDLPPKPKEEAQDTDAKALCNSLKIKREFLRILNEGGHLNDTAIMADVDKAIADLDAIIQAFPDKDFW